MQYLLTIFLFLIATAAFAVEPGGVFYQWTDADGIVSATDDLDMVPEAYRHTVQKRTWEELFSSMAGKTTLATNPALGKPGAPVMVNPPQPMVVVNPPQPAADADPTADCTEPVTTRRVRVQEGDYNRSKILALDECGRPISITNQHPEIHISR
jgi:hypothetical protein